MKSSRLPLLGMQIQTMEQFIYLNKLFMVEFLRNKMLLTDYCAQNNANKIKMRKKNEIKMLAANYHLSIFKIVRCTLWQNQCHVALI